MARRTKKYKAGQRAMARYGGICPVSGVRFEAGAHLIYTGDGWRLMTEADHLMEVTAQHPASNLASGGVIRDFERLADLLDRAESPPVPWALAAYSDSPEPVDGFAMTANFEEARVLAREGWLDGCREVGPLAAWITSKARRLVHDQIPVSAVSGQLFDVGLVCAGEPECWVEFEETETEKPGSMIVRINVAVAVSGGIRGADIVRRGSAIAALCIILDSLGVPVELWASDTTLNSRGGVAVAYHCCLKRAGEPLELDRVAFALAHPAFARRYIFALMEREELSVQRLADVGGSYGRAGESRTTMDTIYVRALDASESAFQTDAGALAWVLGILREQGVEIEDTE